MSERLGKKPRVLLLVAHAYREKHGRGPTWTQLMPALDVKRIALASMLEGLRQRGLVTYTDDEPGSLQVTALGARAALGGPPVTWRSAADEQAATSEKSTGGGQPYVARLGDRSGTLGGHIHPPPQGGATMATTTSKRSSTGTAKAAAAKKPAAKKPAAEKPAVDVAAIEKELMKQVKAAVPGSVWTKKAFYVRLNVKGEKASVVQLWRQKALLRLEFPVNGKLAIFRLHSIEDVPAGVAEVQRRLEDRRAARAA